MTFMAKRDFIVLLEPIIALRQTQKYEPVIVMCIID